MLSRLLIPVCLGFSVSVQAAKPHIQWDQNYDFDSVQTYQWRDTDSPLAENNPLMHENVLADIEAQLTDAGLTRAEDDPDVYVTYHTSTTENVRLESDAWGYGFGGYGTPAWGAWGYEWNGPVSTTTDVVTYDTGTLVVDIWDAEQQKLVWRASYSKVFSDNPAKAEKQVAAAIESMGKRWRKLQG